MTTRITRRALAGATLGALALASLACAGAAQPAHQPADHANPAPSPFAHVDALVAVIYPTQGNDVRGVVRFTPTDHGVKVVADVTGLEPNSEHGFHIHEYGDATAPDGTSAGGHYNPEGHDHALPGQSPRHAGDLGNLKADASGRAHLEVVVTNISLAGPSNPIIGRGLIVHAEPDDGGQPTGNAGARVGIGVIGIARTP